MFMVTTPNPDEPTLRDVVSDLQALTNNVQDLAENQREFATKLDKLTVEQERFNDRFSDYQKATQWVVQLAFTLIASATLTVIITSVLR